VSQLRPSQPPVSKPNRLTARRSTKLRGKIAIPGDKSISHRALMLGAAAIGETVVSGLLEAEDVLDTAAAMAALGAGVSRGCDGRWHVVGTGVGGFVEPPEPLDFGNSGTGARLSAGLIATTPITATLTGDASLLTRPMARIIEPLSRFGARIEAAPGGRLPLVVHGARRPVPIQYRLPVASAQVKSACLLAALNTPGHTTVIEPVATRDHTERMLAAFGAMIAVDTHNGERHIVVEGHHELTAQTLTVPGDPSSAAFPLVAALITEGSRVVIGNVLLNPTRIGLIETLIEMGGRIEIAERREQGGEEIGDIVVGSSSLTGVTVPAGRAPSMIDEYPVLAVAAAFASGTTRLQGLGELRHKESDRLAAVAAGLAANGVAIEMGEDWLEVQGHPGGTGLGGGLVATHLDHRIAMAFLVMGLAAEHPVSIDDGRMIATSFPGFTDLLAGLGGDIAQADGAS
jgi:3-phosphoshikimate 1-carboxyvinyltransferase